MWLLIKGELRYNLDLYAGFFLFFLVLGGFLFILGSGFLGQERMGADWIAYFILGVGVFLPLNIKLRWIKEKRDRIHSMFPISLHLISLARFLIFFMTLSGTLLMSLVLFAMFFSLVPDTSTTLLSILAMTGFTMILNAIYFFLVPDLRGFLEEKLLYKAFRIFFICIGIIIALSAFLIVQIGEKLHSGGKFIAFMAALYKGIFQSWEWAIVFLAAGFCLFYLAVWIFEKRRSYTE
jgi:hypothetical protein